MPLVSEVDNESNDQHQTTDPSCGKRQFGTKIEYQTSTFNEIALPGVIEPRGGSVYEATNGEDDPRSDEEPHHSRRCFESEVDHM